MPASLLKSRRNCGVDARCGSQTSARATFCESAEAHRRAELSMILFCSCYVQIFRPRSRVSSAASIRLRRAGARRPVSRVLYPSGTAGDGHSSGTPVTGRLARPTRTAARKPACRPPRGYRRAVPIWSCSRWGLPCRRRRRRRGALLPHPFTLAGGPQPRPAVCFLWHCPWGHPRRALPGTVFPWSPDFPPPPP
jgi:hypothetical protein